ncbi:hypothetical protein GGR06_003202 [Bacteroides reticulotermitis]|uniref:Uncharacterized protein n=1 Tax=Bacteroides reticulotermitis TaxID=1133319 RepID=A0A840CZV8_9BACE|nr:hypothetical protein [Bacteroides reticulotermitis]
MPLTLIWDRSSENLDPEVIYLPPMVESTSTNRFIK